MSRIGKKPILIPENVEVKIEGQKVIVKGPKGELCLEIRPEIKAEVKDYCPPTTLPPKGRAPRKIFLWPQIETKKTKALWGLTRASLANLMEGVTKGYEKKLEIEGLGYKAYLEGSNLVLEVGFSHPVKIKVPEGIKFSVEKNIITVSGVNKESVGQISAKIRKVKPPEPYKGMGIKYLGEIIRKKVGKKAVTVK